MHANRPGGRWREDLQGVVIMFTFSIADTIQQEAANDQKRLGYLCENLNCHLCSMDVMSYYSIVDGLVQVWRPDSMAERNLVVKWILDKHRRAVTIISVENDPPSWMETTIGSACM